MVSSLILTIALFAFGLLVVIRSSRRLLVHLNEQVCSHGPEVGRLQRALNRGQLISLGWGAVVLALMVVVMEMG